MGSPLLILAHPGHELRLFGWMRQARPRVAILTDGSGGAEQDRTDYSRALLETVGAVAGPVLGMASDRAWYAALLAGDPAPWVTAAERIAAAVADDAPALIVADPVEGYNPMHDLMAPLAARVAASLAAFGRAPALATYPLMAGPDAAAVRLVSLNLDAATVADKRAAIAAYAPLAAESERLLAADPTALGEECIIRAPPPHWPATPDPLPPYERVGRERVAAGRYASLVTYAGHVRPAALRLLRQD